MTEDLAGRGKPEQEQAAHHQGRGVEHDVARDVKVDRPTPVARRRDGDQRHRERCGAGPPLEQRLRDAVEQRGIGVQHEVVKRQSGERDAEQVDVPARIGRRVEVEVLEQQDVADREAEPDRGAGRPQRGARLARQHIDQRQAADQQQGEQPHRGEHLAKLAVDRHRSAIQVQNEAVPRRRAGDLEPAGDASGRIARRCHGDGGGPGGSYQAGGGEPDRGAARRRAQQDERGQRGIQHSAGGVQQDQRRE